MKKQYQTFKEFYPFYLREHSNTLCRRLHFIGCSLVLALALAYFITVNGWLLLLVPVAGYGFAWFGHYFFEKNKPATFTLSIHFIA